MFTYKKNCIQISIKAKLITAKKKNRPVKQTKVSWYAATRAHSQATENKYPMMWMKLKINYISYTKIQNRRVRISALRFFFHVDKK